MIGAGGQGEFANRMIMVDKTNNEILRNSKSLLLLLAPFHSINASPHKVEKIMILAM